jgi:hypothetical protein
MLDFSAERGDPSQLGGAIKGQSHFYLPQAPSQKAIK